MNKENSTTVKRVGNFSLAVTVALLATTSSNASTVRSKTEMKSAGTSVQESPMATFGIIPNSDLSEIVKNNHLIVGYANYYTNWSDYSNHSNYNNYYSNWADYSNQSR